MDKSWVKLDKKIEEYCRGVINFLDYVCKDPLFNGKVSCPCKKCTNSCSWTRNIVRDHLLCHGINPHYNNWFFYKEPMPTSSSNTCNEGQENCHPQTIGDIHGMLHEVFNMPNQFNVEANYDESPRESLDDAHQPMQGISEDARKFYDLLKDAEQPLYEGCKNFSKLSAVLVLYHLKCLHGLSNKGFSQFLEVIQDMLPIGAKLPTDAYEAKKYIKDLGLGYEKIDTCPKGCILYRKENANAELCPKCKTSRWVTNENFEDPDLESENIKKRKAAKVLRWFPLKPRLQRLFMSSKTAPMMRWHADSRTKDGMMRHPADTKAWKAFDERHLSFSSDPRNVRLALASDGFNPFRNMSTAYSCWPVILIPYNMPPWVCMKRSNFILSLLIPGPTSPSYKIDVYLQPLIEELMDLWEHGLDTYDIHAGETFQMRAALLWTINDFPAYGDLSGWKTKGALACPCCNYDTNSFWLKHGGKYCFMGHRRFLHENHIFRRDRASFDGKQEKNPAPNVLSGSDVLYYTESVTCDFGEAIGVSKGKRKREEPTQMQPWRKRSIFFKLPYWEYNLLRHNLDVMHIEKNVCDNLLGTLLNVNGKTKDNVKARLDLQEMGIRSELHPQTRGSNKVYKPPACFTMSVAEKDAFLKVLKNVKVPDGYSSNLSRCVQLKERKIIGLKSHDCHILMQQLLAIALRGSLPKRVTMPLIELCCIFRELCSKELCVQNLDQLESRISETLCKLERIFPPSFFTIMVHLITHLASEAKVGGPVQYRWMYPIERYLLRLKFHVRNRAYPEGSIAEGYLAEECLTFCSRYLESVETLFNRPSRNIDDSMGSISNFTIDHHSLIQAHRYILFNSDEITPFRAIHKDTIKRQRRGTRPSDELMEKVHTENFVEWFQAYVHVNDNGRDEDFNEKIRWLARKPNNCCRRFKGYVVNGTKYRTIDSEGSKRTQNSGVYVEIEGGTTYYGIIVDIIELNYFDKERYVLFKCNWADITPNKGYKKDEFGFDLVNFSHLIHTGKRVSDDPFILASQARQAFYIEDERYKNWLVALKTKPRDVYDVGTTGMNEDVDTFAENETYDLVFEGLMAETNDDLDWVRRDIDGTTINRKNCTETMPVEGDNRDYSDDSECEDDM